MPERQHCLDQARHPRCRIQVPYVRLDRTHRAVTLALRVPTKRLCQRRHLDRIPQHRARAVRLHITDRVRTHIRRTLRRTDHRRLSAHARRRVTHLVRAIVVGRTAPDHRMDRISVPECILQSLQYHHTHATARYRTRRFRIECTAMTIGRIDRTRLVQISRPVLHIQRHSACQCHVTLIPQQRLAGHMNRHE